jgi:hypothetical protein
MCGRWNIVSFVTLSLQIETLEEEKETSEVLGRTPCF